MHHSFVFGSRKQRIRKFRLVYLELRLMLHTVLWSNLNTLFMLFTKCLRAINALNFTFKTKHFLACDIYISKFSKHQSKQHNSPPCRKFSLSSRSWQFAGSMQYNPAPIGVEVRGIDLKQHVPDQIIQQIKKDVHKHRLLIFKNQGIISADRHVEISRWFGELESTFYKHPKSPHPDVFRVSNCEEEGCTNVGRTGWHIDGSFMEKPFSYALYHMVAVPKNGNTGKNK